MAAMWRLTNIFVRPTDGTFETWRSELKFKSQRPGYGDLIHVWLELLKGPVEPVQLFQGAVQFLDMLNWATLVRSRLEICQNIYTTKFSCVRILHIENA